LYWSVYIGGPTGATVIRGGVQGTKRERFNLAILLGKEKALGGGEKKAKNSRKGTFKGAVS